VLARMRKELPSELERFVQLEPERSLAGLGELTRILLEYADHPLQGIPAAVAALPGVTVEQPWDELMLLSLTLSRALQTSPEHEGMRLPDHVSLALEEVFRQEGEPRRYIYPLRVRRYAQAVALPVATFLDQELRDEIRRGR